MILDESKEDRVDVDKHQPETTKMSRNSTCSISTEELFQNEVEKQMLEL